MIISDHQGTCDHFDSFPHHLIQVIQGQIDLEPDCPRMPKGLPIESQLGRFPCVQTWDVIQVLQLEPTTPWMLQGTNAEYAWAPKRWSFGAIVASASCSNHLVPGDPQNQQWPHNTTIASEDRIHYQVFTGYFCHSQGIWITVNLFNIVSRQHIPFVTLGEHTISSWWVQSHTLHFSIDHDPNEPQKVLQPS